MLVQAFYRAKPVEAENPLKIYLIKELHDLKYIYS